MSETPSAPVATPAPAPATNPAPTAEQIRIENLEHELRRRDAKAKKTQKIGGIVLLVLVLFLGFGFAVKAIQSGPAATASVETAVSNDSVNTNNNTATAKSEADAAKEAYERELAELREQIAQANKPAPAVDIEATVEKAVAAAIAKTAPAPATTTSTEGDIVSQMNEGLRLQYGTARVHSETTPPPGLTWLDVGSIQIPIFRNPHEGNKWAFITGDLLNGVKTPPRPHEVPVPSGRTWVPVTQANIPPGGAVNPDGQDMQIHLALQDGAIIYGTVPIR